MDAHRRRLISNNHTATHLLDYALREVLGAHVEQKGSYVSDEYLRFDFSHFQKVTDEELQKVAAIVNRLIRENIPLEEHRSIPMGKAQKMGALALFGEKYGDLVRVVKFGDSIELCGGIHARATGQIGFFKMISESSVSAGVRRIEAISADKAEDYIVNHFNTAAEITKMFKTKKGIMEHIISLLKENEELREDLKKFTADSLKIVKDALKKEVRTVAGINLIIKRVDDIEPARIKELATQLRGDIENIIVIFGGVFDGKPSLTVAISEKVVAENGLHAGLMVKEAAAVIKGGGGGQPFFAMAGGTDSSGVDKALNLLEKMVIKQLQ
ncbi:hypothetical protein FACS1894199_19400 [Bacteroidia bacterium]|nr:hypothetical protein FACS1894199_19400 [Bacteroidia bacterium]